MNELQGTFAVSQRRACRVVDQPRQTQRYQQKVRDDEPALIKQILELVREYPRYGYRFIWAKLRQLGWKINKKRVHRIWRQAGNDRIFGVAGNDILVGGTGNDLLFGDSGLDRLNGQTGIDTATDTGELLHINIEFSP